MYVIIVFSYLLLHPLTKRFTYALTKFFIEKSSTCRTLRLSSKLLQEFSINVRLYLESSERNLFTLIVKMIKI